MPVGRQEEPAGEEEEKAAGSQEERALAEPAPAAELAVVE